MKNYLYVLSAVWLIVIGIPLVSKPNLALGIVFFLSCICIPFWAALDLGSDKKQNDGRIRFEDFINVVFSFMAIAMWFILPTIGNETSYEAVLGFWKTMILWWYKKTVKSLGFHCFFVIFLFCLSGFVFIVFFEFFQQTAAFEAAQVVNV